MMNGEFPVGRVAFSDSERRIETNFFTHQILFSPDLLVSIRRRWLSCVPCISKLAAYSTNVTGL